MKTGGVGTGARPAPAYTGLTVNINFHILAKLKDDYGRLYDLDSWRSWLLDALSAVFVIVFPLSLIPLVPLYLAHGHYVLFVLNFIMWFVLILRVFFPRVGYRIKISVWIILLYTLTVSYFIVLGPGYNRPVWMLTCVVMVSVFMGRRAVVASVALNIVLLLAGYVILGPSMPHWEAAYRDGLSNWGIFIVNSSLLSLMAGLSVGLLISRLDVSLSQERRALVELQAVNEELEASSEEFEAQNAELIRSQQELASKESFLRRITENVPAAIFRLSLDTLEFEYVNENALGIVGYAFDKEGIANDLADRVLPPESKDRVYDFWFRFMQGEDIPFFRFEITHQSGSRRWLEQRLVLIRDGNGSPSAVEGFAIDITAQVEADEALRASEKQFRELVESINEVIFTVDAAGNLTYISPGIKRFGDFNPDDAYGKSFLDFIHPDDREFLVKRFVELGRGVEMPFDYRIVSPTGEWRWVQSFSQPRFIDGVFTGASGIITDIHERRLAEEEIRRSRSTLESFVNALPGPAFLLDEGLKLLVVNTALERALHRSRNELLGMPASELDPLKKLLTYFDTCFNEGLPEVDEKEFEKKTYLVHFYPVFDDTGKVSRVAVFALDITMQKIAEAERERTRSHLIQAQKMDAVGTLAGGIAHDFNNMLGGIMGSINMVELLMDKDGALQKDAILKYIETAMASSQRAAEMTRQLLSLSRKSELKPVPVDINLSMKHVMTLCKNSFPKTVDLRFSIGQSPLMVMADPVQIEQMLLNLCVNGSQAMTMMRGTGEAQGGVLEVRADEVLCGIAFCSEHSDARPGDAYIKILVSDSGVGMDSDVRRHIFDPFYTTKATGSGTGLGLSMVYNIVKQHGGFIDVVSEPGSGSTFEVYLPLFAGDAAPGSHAARQGIVPGSGLVLVIDDEEPLLKIARGMLELCGYSVMTALTADEGIEKFRSSPQPVSAVVLDLALAGSSGIDVYKSLTQIDPGVKVILASGLMEDDVLKSALAMGIMDFIQKPYTAEGLTVKLSAILSRRANEK
ncbi:MAG TPA: PAS domain S-box protein [Spirochaetota bacterium]|nr:PAS domain S-box protein [Spirochaetota bacterium]HPI91229.1 PAS domain S-box protein [Spirochaetota bacterium]HPR49860.1 PAS domain S-box protein [Spirochaetota bacterium]